MSLKQEVHNKLWQAFQRWEDLRRTGVDKRELKMRGIREAGDPNKYTRNLIISGETLRTYDDTLKKFVEMAAKEHGITRLSDIGRAQFRAFMDKGIAEGRGILTLNRERSALAKLGALIGKTESFKALPRKYGARIRELGRAGALPLPTRMTPSGEVVEKAIGILRQWDARHFARTGQCRGYHLAARLQMETSVRSVSATVRVGPESIRDDGSIALVGKGGKVQPFELSRDLHKTLSLYFRHNPGPLAPQRAYQLSYRRAIETAGGRVKGTHGARRRSAREFCKQAYKEARKSGLSPGEASDKAQGDAVERLGHGRNRIDHRRWYLSA